MLFVGAEEHVLLAALDVQVAIGVDDTIVARVIPSVSVERLGSSLRVLEIAQHGVGATREYLAGNVRRVAAVYANLHACHLAAARAGMTLLVEEHGDERSALGGSVGLGQRDMDGKQLLRNSRIDGGAAGNDVLDPPAKGLDELAVQVLAQDIA